MILRKKIKMIALFMILIFSCIMQYAVSIVKLFDEGFESKHLLIWSFIPFGYIIIIFHEIKKQYKNLKKEN